MELTDEKCRELWNASETFQQLQKNMVLFLEGKCNENPWHLGQVDPETVPLLETLREINRRGFVTTEGQPGTISEQVIAIDTSFGKPGEKYTEVQRGYIAGFILNSRADSFVERLLRTQKVVVYREKLNAINVYGLEGNMMVPGQNNISLTEERGSRKVNYYSKLHLPDPPGQSLLSVISANKKLEKILKDNATVIYVIMKKQGDTSLDKIVLSCLPK